MTFAATADVGRFDEAVEWFAARFPVTQELLEALGEYAGARAWTIAAVTHLDSVLAAHEVITNAIESGQELSRTVEQLRDALSAYGFSGHRLETIVLTNSANAYSAGRWQQLNDPDLLEVRPYRQFDGIGDFRQTDTCRLRDGTTLPATDSWWLTNWPPLHHRCRSTVRSLASWEVDEDVPDEKLTAPIDTEPTAPGFGLTPDIELPWRPDLAKYPPELREAVQRKRPPTRGANMTVGPDAKARSREVFGRELSRNDALDLIGLDDVDHGEISTFGSRVIVRGMRSGVNIEREFYRDAEGRLTAKKAAFFVPRASQGVGLARPILLRQMAAYEAAGVKRVTMDAAEVGRYVWLRAGYVPRSDAQISRIKAAFAEYLTANGWSNGASVAQSLSLHEIARFEDENGRQLGKEFLLGRSNPERVIGLEADVGGEEWAKIREYYERQ